MMATWKRRRPPEDAPMRKVARTGFFVDGQHDETLECGHTLQAMKGRAKSRRCPKCAPSYDEWAAEAYL